MRFRWLCLVLSFASQAHGIVNTEPLRYRLSQDHRLGQLQGAFGGKDGNSRGLFLNASLFGGLLSEPHLGFVDLSGKFAKFNSEVTDQSSFAHVRYNFRPLTWMHPEVYGQVESDKFRRLRMRALVGSGPRIGIVPEALFLGSSYMLEHEEEIDRNVLSHRWSNYLAVYLRFSETTVLANTVYYQPRFDKFADFRALNAWTFEIKLSKKFSTGVSLLVRYDSEPPAAVKRTDWELLNTLGWQVF